MVESKPVRKFINLPKDNDGPIGRWLALHEGEHPASALSKATERYLTVIGRSVPGFDDSEWCLVFDALRPPWPADYSPADMLTREVADAIAADHLDEKWGVDGTRLKGRVSRLSFAEKVAVSEIAEAFWKYPAGPESLHEIISTIKTAFQPPATSRTSSPIRRLSTDRLETHPVPPEKQSRGDEEEDRSPGNDYEGGPGLLGGIQREGTDRTASEDDRLETLVVDPMTESEPDEQFHNDGQELSRPLL